MTFTNTFKTEPVLTTIAIILALLIAVKFTIWVLILLILFYILATRLLLDLEILFHPKHPYHKFLKFTRGCFVLEDSIWLDNGLDSEFSALTKFCKDKKYHITLFTEQLDTFSKAYKEDSSLKVFNRIAEMQKAKVLRLLPAVKAPASKPNPFCEYIKDEKDEKATNIGIIYEAPLPPKPKNPKKEFIKALKHYSKICQMLSYVSKDSEIKVIITDHNEKTSGNKINIYPYKQFIDSLDYIDRFKIKFVEAHKKKKKAKDIKKKDRKKQIENIKEAASSLSQEELIKKRLEEKTEKIAKEEAGEVEKVEKE